MAFKLPYRVGCDNETACSEEEIVYARSEEEANRRLEDRNWRIVAMKEYKHLCPKHARYGSVE